MAKKSTKKTETTALTETEEKPVDKKAAPAIPAATGNKGIATVVASRGATVVSMWGNFKSRSEARPFRNQIADLAKHDGSDLHGCIVRIARGRDHPDGTTVDLHHLVGDPQASNRKQRKNKRHMPRMTVLDNV